MSLELPSSLFWLYAVGPEDLVQRWPLTPGEYLVGRATPEDGEGKLGVRGDARISRSHLSLCLGPEGARVRACSEQVNPIFFEGEARLEFTVHPGQHFVVGGTDFQLVAQTSGVEQAAPALEFTLAHAQRDQLRERQARQCLQALTRLLPRLRQAASGSTLWQASLELLQGLLPRATDLFALRMRGREFEVLHSWHDGRPGLDRPLPSRRLLSAAFSQGETALHLFQNEGGLELTVQAGGRWAMAAPIPVGEQEAFALYAQGASLEDTHSGDSPGEQERVLFDLVAETLGHHLVAHQMGRLQAQVGQFFSPALRPLLLHAEANSILEPGRRQVTVLFFDLRGFSRATEQADAGDQEDPIAAILAHHERLTEVMTEVTECVFAEGGIVVDYQGDAVMACWGAPLPCEDHALRAVRAAHTITARIHALELPFGAGRRTRCGIGIGTGEVVAGQVGARGQIKYGVMGAVVNTASRLEGLTKYLGVPILATAEAFARLDDSVLCRRVGRVRPAGIAEAVEVYEVVVPYESGGSGLTAEEVQAYETGQRHFEEARMLEALKALRGVPVEDPVGSFLTRQTYHYQAEGLPPEWDGVIEFTRK